MIPKLQNNSFLDFPRIGCPIEREEKEKQFERDEKSKKAKVYTASAVLYVHRPNAKSHQASKIRTESKSNRGVIFPCAVVKRRFREPLKTMREMWLVSELPNRELSELSVYYCAVKTPSSFLRSLKSFVCRQPNPLSNHILSIKSPPAMLPVVLL